MNVIQPGNRRSDTPRSVLVCILMYIPRVTTRMSSSHTETSGTEHETLSRRQRTCNVLNKTRRFTTTVLLRVSLPSAPALLGPLTGQAQGPAPACPVSCAAPTHLHVGTGSLGPLPAQILSFFTIFPSTLAAPTWKVCGNRESCPCWVPSAKRDDDRCPVTCRTRADDVDGDWGAQEKRRPQQ